MFESTKFLTLQGRVIQGPDHVHWSHVVDHFGWTKVTLCLTVEILHLKFEQLGTVWLPFTPNGHPYESNEHGPSPWKWLVQKFIILFNLLILVNSAVQCIWWGRVFSIVIGNLNKGNSTTVNKFSILISFSSTL